MRSITFVALAVTMLVIAADARQLQQDDALSNSNGCLGNIPKCEAGACATRNIMGVARWTCLRCRGNYDPVVDSSGQDNIIQCVCPKGTYQDAANADTCTRCPQNSFCPGGDKVENPTSYGTNNTCGANLITRNSGARSQADCVAPQGYSRTTPTSATACAKSEYAPMYNRLTKCLKCQSGLEEPDVSALTDGQRSSKKAVCYIPPGKYVSQGLVRICPQGFYREQWLEFDNANGTLCLPCRPGITTDGAGAGLSSLCNKVVPGYGIQQLPDGVTTTPNLTAAITTGGLPTASLCELGYYSLNGYCVSCPSGTVTTAKGAKSIEECMVPPGYYVPAGAAMTKCASTATAGFFREGWVMYSDIKAASCTPCGDGILSESREIDVNPKAANGSLVSATSAACFIDAGQGMIAQGKNLFVGRDCPINTYGAAGKVYGWNAAPCKPCPRNMITDNLSKVSNSSLCINDDGFGYASEGASRCAPGFYSAKGSRKPCQQCPAGRTTADDPKQQRVSTDCLIAPGFGVVNSTGNGTDAFNPDNTTNPETMPALECPIGYFGRGGSAGTKCEACPLGSTTQLTGSTDPANCTLCIPGYGQNTTGQCVPCAQGTYQPGPNPTCLVCPTSTFYSPVDGNGTAFTSNGITTYTGSINQEACVPIQSQLSPEAGQAYIAPTDANTMALYTPAPAASLAACIASCPANKCCMAQYDVNSTTCYTVQLDAVSSEATTGQQLVYKLPPSTLGSASSVKTKMMSSGFYAHCAIPAAQQANWLAAGSNLDDSGRVFAKSTTWKAATRADCKKACDNSNVCWGFVWSPTSGCSFRGGVDAVRTRSFFSLPSSLDMGGFKW